jgi:hypothetical protein
LANCYLPVAICYPKSAANPAAETHTDSAGTLTGSKILDPKDISW